MGRKIFNIIFFVTAIILGIISSQINASNNPSYLHKGGFGPDPIVNPIDNIAMNGADQKKLFFNPATQKEHRGKCVLALNSHNPHDARVIRHVNLKPNTYYSFSGWAAVNGIYTPQTGANLSIYGTWNHSPPE